MSIDPELKKKIDQSLRLSRHEGVPAAVMIGITEYYLTPLGLLLGATTQQIGLLAALPHLLASVSQLFAVRAVSFFRSRLQFVVSMATLQGVLLVPVAALPLLEGPHRIATLIGLVAVFRILANLIGPAWGSIMSDYLPPEKRGDYFGRRSQLVGAAQVAGMGLAGVILTMTREHAPGIGFFLIFLWAAGARLYAARLLSRLADLPLQASKEHDFTFVMFLRRFRESNFVKFVFYVASITFAAHIAAPFFSVFMLRDLRFNYLTYMLINLAGIVTSLLTFPVWGKHADAAGNARVLKTTGFLTPVIPLLWVVWQNPVWLFCVEMLSGFVWGGFGLCATNFIYDAVTPEKRVRCLGYFNLINGVALFAGASLGGWLAGVLPPLAGFRLLSLFALSGGLRFVADFALARHFQEVRQSSVRLSSAQLFFSAVGVRPMLGENQEPVFPIRKILKLPAKPAGSGRSGSAARPG